MSQNKKKISQSFLAFKSRKGYKTEAKADLEDRFSNAKCIIGQLIMGVIWHFTYSLIHPKLTKESWAKDQHENYRFAQQVVPQFFSSKLNGINENRRLTQ